MVFQDHNALRHARFGHAGMREDFAADHGKLKAPICLQRKQPISAVVGGHSHQLSTVRRF